MPTFDPSMPFLTYHLSTPPAVDVPQAVAGVLSLLPAPGTPWPDVERAKFMSALGAVLDLVYPAVESTG